MYRFIVLVDGSNNYPLSDLNRRVSIDYKYSWEEVRRSITGKLSCVKGPLKRVFEITWDTLSDNPSDGGTGKSTLEYLATQTNKTYKLRVYKMESNYDEYDVIITKFDAELVEGSRREFWGVSVTFEEV